MLQPVTACNLKEKKILNRVIEKNTFDRIFELSMRRIESVGCGGVDVVTKGKNSADIFCRPVRKIAKKI